MAKQQEGTKSLQRKEDRKGRGDTLHLIHPALTRILQNLIQIQILNPHHLNQVPLVIEGVGKGNQLKEVSESVEGKRRMGIGKRGEVSVING